LHKHALQHGEYHSLLAIYYYCTIIVHITAGREVSSILFFLNTHRDTRSLELQRSRVLVERNFTKHAARGGKPAKRHRSYMKEDTIKPRLLILHWIPVKETFIATNRSSVWPSHLSIARLPPAHSNRFRESRPSRASFRPTSFVCDLLLSLAACKSERTER